MALNYLFFWNLKSSSDNAWHPLPGANPIQYIDNLPTWIKRQDIEATAVDVAPFVVGVGALAHLRQLNDFGFTAHASVFRNAKTLMALHRSVLVFTPLVLACQATGLEYRYLVPRWAHEREMRRDEEQVRRHVDVGMYAGVACWAIRMYGLRLGTRYWAPLDVVLGGFLADLAHREYCKAHGLSLIHI